MDAPRRKKSPKPMRTGITEHKRVQAEHQIQKKKEFLQAYEQGGALYWAAHKIGLSPDTIDNWRKVDAQFDADILNAFQRSTDTLKMTAYMRAVKGSDNLTMFLIKQRDPSYRDHFNMDGRFSHRGETAAPSKVPPSIQAAVDVMMLDLVTKMAEKL